MSPEHPDAVTPDDSSDCLKAVRKGMSSFQKPVLNLCAVTSSEGKKNELHINLLFSKSVLFTS